jgi:hypothetical protein
MFRAFEDYYDIIKDTVQQAPSGIEIFVATDHNWPSLVGPQAGLLLWRAESAPKSPWQRVGELWTPKRIRLPPGLFPHSQLGRPLYLYPRGYGVAAA